MHKEMTLVCHTNMVWYGTVCTLHAVFTQHVLMPDKVPPKTRRYRSIQHQWVVEGSSDRFYSYTKLNHGTVSVLFQYGTVHAIPSGRQTLDKT